MSKTYNDICTSQAGDVANTGASGQCLEAVTVLLVLAKNTFKFDSLSDFQSKAIWDAAILIRDLVPLFELYELTPANTEEVYYESRNFRKRTSKASKITTMELYLSLCSHKELKKFNESSVYNTVFEVTEDGDVIGIYDNDGVSIKGQKLKNFTVGIRTAPTLEKVPFTPLSITYNDYDDLEDNGVITTPSFDPVDDLSGIYGVAISEIGTSSATSVVFTATVGCGNDSLDDTTEAWYKFTANDGTDQPITVVYDPATKLFTATGTALVNGVMSTGGIQQDVNTGENFEGSGLINTISAILAKSAKKNK